MSPGRGGGVQVEGPVDAPANGGGGSGTAPGGGGGGMEPIGGGVPNGAGGGGGVAPLGDCHWLVSLTRFPSDS
jgi:hypothetical protein